MKSQAIIIGILLFGFVASWNSLLFLDWKSARVPSKGDPLSSLQAVNSTAKPEPQLWMDIKKTTVEEDPNGGFKTTYDGAVAAVEGQRVELPGVGFLLTSGIKQNAEGDEEVTEFLLVPGNGGVAWCCGLTPISRFEFSVLVDCSTSPFSRSQVDPRSSAMFVNVEGTLRLQKENSINALYTLEEATVEFIDLADVVPPNVVNMCLNQPMVP
ncbi:MAG TPA: hypothetical protein DDW52_17980 [Planctomycetaceae bacterium]|nr:hypothetical protein [Planctomycetaceae bacterium]